MLLIICQSIPKCAHAKIAVHLTQVLVSPLKKKFQINVCCNN